MYQIRFELSVKRMAKNGIWVWTKSQDPEYEGSYTPKHIQYMANCNNIYTVFGTYYVPGTILRMQQPSHQISQILVLVC